MLLCIDFNVRTEQCEQNNFFSRLQMEIHNYTVDMVSILNHLINSNLSNNDIGISVKLSCKADKDLLSIRI